MIIVNERPCNGVDLSHWNLDPLFLADQTWLKFLGLKATHPGGKGMTDGVDAKFVSRRRVAQRLDFRWRAFYCWLVPAHVARPAAQVELLSRTVGSLTTGEAVYLDWEDSAVPKSLVEEISVYMDLVFPNRWFMYVNDSSSDMISWMEANLLTSAVPIMHPNYNIDKGLSEARKWNSMIWQTGTGIPPGFQGDVPIDYVLQPALLDKVCGR